MDDMYLLGAFMRIETSDSLCPRPVGQSHGYQSL